MSFDGHFPVEIVTEILAGLPVKSLLRFRCVSKTWRQIIDSPNFISKHLIHYNSITILNENNNNLENSDYYYHISTLDVGPNQSLNFTIHKNDDTLFGGSTPIMNIGRGFQPCATVDGLILMSLFNGKNNHLRLWNPSIRKSLLFPPLSNINYARYAVGFAPQSNEYKVVAFDFDASDRDYGLSFMVYGLNHRRWRRSNIGMNIVKWHNCEISFECVSAKGAAHWLISFVRPGSYTHVLCFDFDVEMFRLLELPDGGKDMLSLHFLLEESVAVLGVSRVSACIWIMDMQGGERSWTKWYSGDPTSDYDYIFFSGKQRAIRNVLYVKNNGEFFIIVDGELISYNVRSHEIRRLPKFIRSPVYMATHVESLLLHRGFEAKTLSTSFPLAKAAIKGE